MDFVLSSLNFISTHNMMFLMTLIIVVLLGYIFSKSRIVFIVQALVYIVLIGGYNGNIDLVFYRNYYEQEFLSDSYVEGLYYYIGYFFHRCGFSFEMYHLIISAVAIIVIAYVIKKMCPQPALAMSMMFGFCTIEYALQLKNMLAGAIVIYALYYYSNKRNEIATNKSYYKVVYSLLIILASGFHFLSLFFLVFLLIDFVSLKYFKYWIVSTIAIIFLTFQELESFMVLFSEQLADYTYKYRSASVFIGMMIWQIACTALVTMMYHYLKKKPEFIKYKNFFDFVYKGTFLLLLILPFYILTTTVNRVTKIWLVFCFIMTGHISSSFRKFNLIKFAMITFGLASTVFFYFILGDVSDSIFLEIITNNLFFS